MKIGDKLKEIEKLVGGDAAVVKEIIVILIRQTSEQLIQLGQCLKTRDWDALKKIAHTMKSTFLHLNMSDAIQVTEAIEKNAGVNHKVAVKKTRELMLIAHQLIALFDSETGN